MYIALFVILLILWLAGLLALRVAGAFIHALLLLALISLAYHFVVARRRPT